MAGYIVYDNRSNRITEIVSRSPEDFESMIYAWMFENSAPGVDLLLPPWAVEYVRCTSGFAENAVVGDAYNWRIFDWVEVIDALFSIKSIIQKPVDGEVVIDIKGYGPVEIIVRGGLASCARTENKPDLLCEPLTATRLIFGPLPPDYVIGIPERISTLLSSWFPLPLCWLPQDGV